MSGLKNRVRDMLNSSDKEMVKVGICLSKQFPLKYQVMVPTYLQRKGKSEEVIKFALMELREAVLTVNLRK